jgi:ubiquitin-protein ligase
VLLFRPLADVKELREFPGVEVITYPDDARLIDVLFVPQSSQDQEAYKSSEQYRFQIRVPTTYPFHAPSWKWLDAPSFPTHECLGPDGDVSVDALSQWQPTRTLAGVLIALFPASNLANHCNRVTSHISDMDVSSATSWGIPSSLPILAYIAAHNLYRQLYSCCF